MCTEPSQAESLSSDTDSKHQYKKPLSSSDQTHPPRNTSRPNGKSLSKNSTIKATQAAANEVGNPNKITRYLTNYSRNLQQYSEESATYLPQAERKIRELEEIIQEKNKEIEVCKQKKEIQNGRLTRIIYEAKDYKLRAKTIIASTLLETASMRRRERGHIDTKFGYFKDGFKTFIEGVYFTSLRDRIERANSLISKYERLQQTVISPEERERCDFAIAFNKRQINVLEAEISSRQNELCDYKDRLKLAEKESRCHYSQLGWPIVSGQYQTLELLGSGGFGEVYKCYDLEKSEIVALKINLCDKTHLSEDFIKHVNREANIQQSLDHPNITRLMKLLQCTSNRVSFLLEYCSGPQLASYLRRHICLEEWEAKNIIKQVLNALQYLNSRREKIIHYDLKPSNIMFHDGIVKLLDFGLCKIMETDQTKMELTSQGVGTFWYLPPETFEPDAPKVSSKVDVWSAGVIFFELLYGRKPFGHGVPQSRIFNDGIILRAYNVEFPAETPKKYPVSDGAKKFIRDCLQHGPDDRLSPAEAYDHVYFRDAQ